MAAYAGASLAGANMWRTGFTASMLSLPAYILPYVFVLDKSLMLMGSLPQVLLAITRSLAGCVILAYALIGPARNRIEVLQRLMFGMGAVLLIIPRYWADMISILVIFMAALPMLLRAKARHRIRTRTGDLPT
jgi:TRAP-type uncharacterized transport system fused permease subunit